MPKDVNSTLNLSENLGENLGENPHEKATTPSLRGDLSPRRFERSGFRVSENELRMRQHEVKSTSLNSTENAENSHENSNHRHVERSETSNLDLKNSLDSSLRATHSAQNDTLLPSLREIEQGEISKQSTTPNNSNSWIASLSATHFPCNDSDSVNSLENLGENSHTPNLNAENSHENSTQISSALGAQPKAKPKLAIVVPCYNEEAVIEISFAALYTKLTQLIADGLVSRESFLCFVDDGSKDRTCEILCRLKKERGLQSGGFSRDVANLRVNLGENSHTPNLSTENSHENSNYRHVEPTGETSNLDLKNSLDSSLRATHSAQNDTLSPSLRGDLSPRQSTTPNDLNSWIASSSATHFPRNDSTLTNSTENLHTPNLNAKNPQQTPNSTTKNTQNSQQTNAPQAPQVRIVKLSKNYGQQNALLAGLEYVASFCDAAISVDADLQQDINAMDAMVRAFGAGAHIVYGVRKAYAHESFSKKYSSFFFYKLMHFMGVNLVHNHADYRLLSARAIGDLLEFKEVNLFLRGIVPLVGLKSEVVHYEQLARAAGQSHYPLTKMLKFAWDGITSFSIMPLRCLSVLGLCMFVAAAVYGGYALWVRLFNAQTMSGWTSTILIVLIFGGMQFLSLGLIGEYVGKIYQEVKKRPRYFVERVE